MLHLHFFAFLIAALAVGETTASSYGYFLDSSCTVAETLLLEDFCIEAKKCERLSYTANGIKYPGTVYTSPLCAQSDEAVQAMFPKGTKLWVYASYKGLNCTGEFKSPSRVYIADNKCHQQGYDHGYRAQVESNGDVSVHQYLEHDCSGVDVSGVYDYTSKKKIGVCIASSKYYFLVGTREPSMVADNTSAQASAAPSGANANNTDTSGSPSASAPTQKSGSRPHFGLSGAALALTVLISCVFCT
ncbi:hypothetical protein ACHHYP_20077 [Achlya hypogyna]|uniref:Secreted protein n=1 Tax=Achlya hypogyna TaxID=1202772 RepID=A0A1V9Z7X6_ACHHY|nr:hypothetical protein ACHHYP_20077 [Achlya hypogyna]